MVVPRFTKTGGFLHCVYCDAAFDPEDVEWAYHECKINRTIEGMLRFDSESGTYFVGNFNHYQDTLEKFNGKRVKMTITEE